MMYVGIPRALLYYQYFPMWQTFFEELGAEVVVSPPTTKEMVASGSSRVVSDTCLPVKVFLGHILSLVEKCDYLFIPAIRSLKPKIFNCSKFLGLPDVTRAVITKCPPILDIGIDINKGKRSLYQAIHELGRNFTRDEAKVKSAAMAAWKVHLIYRQLMTSHGLTATSGDGEDNGRTEGWRFAWNCRTGSKLRHNFASNHHCPHRASLSTLR